MSSRTWTPAAVVLRELFPRLLLCLVPLVVGAACSTGDPDTMPADAGRIQRTTAKIDSSLNKARDHMRTIDTLGRRVE